VKRPGGETGRHAILRGWCRKASRFESAPGHGPARRHCSSGVEHSIRNRAVVGSNPTSGSVAFRSLPKPRSGFFLVRSPRRVVANAHAAVTGVASRVRNHPPHARVHPAVVRVELVPREPRGRGGAYSSRLADATFRRRLEAPLAGANAFERLENRGRNSVGRMPASQAGRRRFESGRPLLDVNIVV
jgi:hypothetical protein